MLSRTEKQKKKKKRLERNEKSRELLAREQTSLQTQVKKAPQRKAYAH